MQNAYAKATEFQSTLSMRRATIQVAVLPVSLVISIHALHEESDQSFLASHVIDGEISIHALHEESDARFFDISNLLREFQSTLSMRRATKSLGADPDQIAISIHALHEESDHIRISTILTSPHFNPRSP